MEVSKLKDAEGRWFRFIALRLRVRSGVRSEQRGGVCQQRTLKQLALAGQPSQSRPTMRFLLGSSTALDSSSRLRQPTFSSNHKYPKDPLLLSQ